jgi:hypothetical protein
MAEKAKELTLEQKLALAEERAERAEAEAKANAEAKVKAEALAEEKSEALEASKENNPNADLIVEGSFKSKKTKKTYGFKLGNVKVRKQDGSIISSVDALKDSETMEWLVKIGSAVIEQK